AGGPDLKLAYRASGELLIVSTAEDLGREMVTIVYDVSDLLTHIPRFADARRVDPTGLGGAGLHRQGGQQSTDERERNQDDDADIQKLVELIIQTVEPDSWTDNGGLGTIQAFRNVLVVWNNIRVHQALGGYVEESD
ncbi:MAG: hypothetical protein ACE5I3_07695, partial [Phycisphaerae bacterium]